MGKKIGFIFAGQGAQFPGMGHDLHQNSKAARKVFEAADESLNKPLTELCFNGSEKELTDTANCQPAIYAVSIACLAFLQEKIGMRLQPAACAGLSLGEFAALHAGSAITFPAGLKMLDQRGQLMAQACRETDGAMAAVLNGDVAQVEEVCRQCQIDVANYNCPGQLVISGRRDGVKKAIAELKALEIKKVIPLQVAGAFHSRFMDGAAERFAEVVEQTEVCRPGCPVVQNTVGQPVDEPEEIKNNLKNQVNGSVRWEKCARYMMEKVDLLIEFGPGTVLSGFVKRIDRRFPAFPAGTVEQIEELAALDNW